MQSDMYNLFPAVGSVNAARSNTQSYLEFNLLLERVRQKEMVIGSNHRIELKVK